MKYENKTKDQIGYEEMMVEYVWCIEDTEELYIIDEELWVKEGDGFFCPVVDSAYPNRYGFETIEEVV